jgi:nucleotide-binding universal stress UspA family protein
VDVLFHRILSAVDFSPDAFEAFQVSVETARAHAAALHIFHVIETQPAGTAEAALRLLEKANNALEMLVASEPSSMSGLMFTTEVASGLAAAEIVNRTRQWEADLIVLGSKGTTSLAEMVLGGTAEQVVKEAPSSVLVVRLREKT